MKVMTLGDLRASGGMIKIECLRCGAVERRDPASLGAPDDMTLGAVALALTCAQCGAQACIADAAPPDSAPSA